MYEFIYNATLGSSVEPVFLEFEGGKRSTLGRLLKADPRVLSIQVVGTLPQISRITSISINQRGFSERSLAMANVLRLDLTLLPVMVLEAVL